MELATSQFPHKYVSVIARSLRRGNLMKSIDCFASLAMTGYDFVQTRFFQIFPPLVQFCKLNLSVPFASIILTFASQVKCPPSEFQKNVRAKCSSSPLPSKTGTTFSIDITDGKSCWIHCDIAKNTRKSKSMRMFLCSIISISLLRVPI
jgi:hypothetical protein